MVFKIFLHAFAMIFGNFGSVLRASVVPFSIFFALLISAGYTFYTPLVSYGIQTVGWFGVVLLIIIATLILFLPILSWMAVLWHRFILLGEAIGMFPSANVRQIWSYAWRVLLFAFVNFAFFLTLTWIINSIVVIRRPDSQIASLSGLLLILIYLGVVALWFGAFLRFSIVLVGFAVGKPIRLRDAWRLTSDRSSAILVAAVLSILVCVLLAVGIKAGVDLMLESLPVDQARTIAICVVAVRGWFVTMLGISLITAIYFDTIEEH